MVAVSIKYVANVDAHDVELPARSAILHVDARRVIRMTWESGYLFLRFPPRRRFGGFPPSDGASGYPPSADVYKRQPDEMVQHAGNHRRALPRVILEHHVSPVCPQRRRPSLCVQASPAVLATCNVHLPATDCRHASWRARDSARRPTREVECLGLRAVRYEHRDPHGRLGRYN